MDKFGIFKLLNSFFTMNGQSNNENSAESEQNSTSLNGFLNAINNGLSALKTNNAPAQPIPTKPTRAVQPPLQSSMLSTMSNHDQLIKRIKEKNKV